MGGHGGRWPVEALDLDQAGLGDAALTQLRSADVERERVGIAVLLERPVGSDIRRVEPGARREPHYATADAVAQPCRGQAGAAIVEHAQKIAVGDAAGCRIVVVDRDRQPAASPTAIFCACSTIAAPAWPRHG